MIAVGLLLVLVGFALIVPRGAMAGSAAIRNVSLGHSQLFRTRGYQNNPSLRNRIIRIAIGLLMLAGGFVLIAISS